MWMLFFYLAKGEAEMKRGNVMTNVFPRLKGMSLIGMMVLALTSGAVMGAEETEGFHLYKSELVDGKPVEVKGFTETERTGAIAALQSKSDAKIAAFAKDHMSNARQVVEGFHGALKAQFTKLVKADKDTAVSKLKDFSKSLVERIGKLDAKFFGDKEKKDAFLKVIGRISELKDEELKKALTDKGPEALENFLRRLFEGEGDEKEKVAEWLKALGLSLEKPEEEAKNDEIIKTGVTKEKPKTGNLVSESVPNLGNEDQQGTNKDQGSQQQQSSGSELGEQNIDALAEQMCQDQLAREQNLKNSFLASLNDIKDQLSSRDERPEPVANQQPPENGILKALEGLLGQEEEQPRVAEAAPPAPPTQQPPAESRRNNNQIPQPPAPVSAPPVMPFTSQAASTVPPVDATPAKTPTTGKSALSKASTVAEAVKPISEMEPPVAAQILQPNPGLSPQANAQNVEGYFAQAAQYVDSYRRSINNSLSMVREEKRNLAKQKQTLSDEIDGQLEKQLPDDIKTAKQTAQQELDTAKQELKQAEQQAATMMASVDPSNASAAQMAASQTVAQANAKISQAQQRVTQLSQVEKDWKANQGKIDSSLKSRLERMETAEAELTTRESALNERMKDVQNIAGTNERNKQQSLALVNSVNTQNQNSNVNLISGANLNGNSRRNNGGLGGAINQSSNPSGSRAPLAGTF
jgi:hypothetical protein